MAQMNVSVFLLLLFAASFAQAQGLTGGLKGLREAYFMMWGAGVVIPAIFLGIAFLRLDQHGRDARSLLLTLPSMLYIPVAIGILFMPSTDLSSKIPGAMGFALLFGLIVFYTPNSRVARISLSVLAGAALAVLLWIPNEYWEVPLVSFERVEYVDNVAPEQPVGTLRSRSAPKSLIALEDGRHLLQSGEGLRRKSSGKLAYPYGEMGVLEDTGDGSAFNIRFINRTYRYATSSTKRSRYVIPLSTRTEPMYNEAGTGQAVWLEDLNSTDYDRLLRELLRTPGGWNVTPDDGDVANIAYWVRVVTELADIDMQSPKFLTRIYRGKENRARFLFLLDAGVSPNATDRDGNTMLHIAARNGNINSFRMLLDRGADPKLINKRKQTALDIARRRSHTNPQTTPIKTFEDLVATHNAVR